MKSITLVDIKAVWVALVSILGFWPGEVHAEQIARARMHCLSLRFGYGTGETGLEKLELTTLPAGINGELAPIYGPCTHWSRFELFDQLSGTVKRGVLFLDTPAFTDANNNGYDDFFEVACPVSGMSTGMWRYAGETNYIALTATWMRPAGSVVGECVLNFDRGGAFTHPFYLLEFTGAVAFVAGSNVVSGVITLTQVGATNNRLSGPVSFKKVAPDRFDRLELQSGTVTNAQGEQFAHLNALFYRRPAWPTNYYGYVALADGDPLTPAAADYWLWLFAIDDANDSDGDGVPDFSDDPAIGLPRAPVLQLILGPTNLILRISGDVGRVHQILETPSLTTPVWTTNTTLVLTNDPQTVSLPVPSGTRFWRVRAF
ncbi:MAG: hypothetical protein N2379_08205 [Verrucomicrobiae bacterium]|nr:hypothetical protein [Verrucomicrobiae bacterium]MDW7981117.1 hypothetical protein [Verrucomicrobiales bacterium]